MIDLPPEPPAIEVVVEEPAIELELEPPVPEEGQNCPSDELGNPVSPRGCGAYVGEVEITYPDVQPIIDTGVGSTPWEELPEPVVEKALTPKVEKPRVSEPTPTPTPTPVVDKPMLAQTGVNEALGGLAAACVTAGLVLILFVRRWSK